MYDFAQKIIVFHEKYLPEQGMTLAGYSSIIHTFKLKVPIPYRIAAISSKNRRYKKGEWIVFGSRYLPANTLLAQLTFALKYEGVNLSVLKALFKVIDDQEIINIIANEPTSSYVRRVWFLYEWLMEKVLAIPDSKPLGLVDVIDPKLQYAGSIQISKRHRVRNNLPGVPGFCPTIYRTKKIDSLIAAVVNTKITVLTSKIHSDVLARAAAFLLLQDSKASYAIEGEHPPQNRAERWGRAIGQAGQYPLTHEEILRLQEIVINDFRFTHYGYRNEGGFIGEHDRDSQQPIPQHISAKWEDVYDLMDALFKTNLLLSKSDFDPVLAAAVVAFGFVFIHPLEDGNGRIHRYLIHHVFAEKNYVPKGLVFPISAVILKRLDDYKQVLEKYSGSVYDLIEWRPTDKNNVEVLNDTKDFYSYFDATPQAEFLYECTKETIEETLPEEIEYLQKHDAMKQFIINYIDMPERFVELLITFLRKGNGKFSKRALTNEFKDLNPEEVVILEKKYAEIFLK